MDWVKLVVAFSGGDSETLEEIPSSVRGLDSLFSDLGPELDIYVVCYECELYMIPLPRPHHLSTRADVRGSDWSVLSKDPRCQKCKVCGADIWKRGSGRSRNLLPRKRFWKPRLPSVLQLLVSLPCVIKSLQEFLATDTDGLSISNVAEHLRAYGVFPTPEQWRCLVAILHIDGIATRGFGSDSSTWPIGMSWPTFSKDLQSQLGIFYFFAGVIQGGTSKPKTMALYQQAITDDFLVMYGGI